MHAHHPAQTMLAAPMLRTTAIGAAAACATGAQPNAAPLTKNERLAFAIQAHQARRAMGHHSTANLDAACRLLVCMLAAHHLAGLGVGSECQHLTGDAVAAARAAVARASRHASAGALSAAEAEHIGRALATLDLQTQSAHLTDAVWHIAMQQVQHHITAR